MPTLSESESQHARSARRAGWLLLAAAVLAAAAERVDPSNLTQMTAYAQDGHLRLEYSLLDHAGTPTKLRLWVAPGLDSDGKLRVRMSQRYLRLMRIDRVSPEPERVETGEEDIVFVFKAPPRGDPATIEFDVQPLEYGRRDGRLAVTGDHPVEFTQYLVP